MMVLNDGVVCDNNDYTGACSDDGNHECDYFFYLDYNSSERLE